MQPSPYLLSSPPRKVPWQVRSQALFGGVFSQIGWIFFGFGMIFTWAFGLQADLSPILFGLASLASTQAVISDIQGTGASENDIPVMANHYIFRVEREESEYRGVSYTTGQPFDIGQEVTVEYLASNPNRSRIEGARANAFSAWVLCLVGLFPLIGLIFITISLKQGLRDNRLLSHGVPGTGTLVKKEATNTRVNNRPLYMLTFEFTSETGQRCQATAKSHIPEKLQDEAHEQLLYNPANPNQVVLMDNLPGAPDIDEFGQITTANPGTGLWVLIVPLLAIMVHSTVCLFVLVGS